MDDSLSIDFEREFSAPPSDSEQPAPASHKPSKHRGHRRHASTSAVGSTTSTQPSSYRSSPLWERGLSGFLPSLSSSLKGTAMREENEMDITAAVQDASGQVPAPVPATASQPPPLPTEDKGKEKEVEGEAKKPGWQERAFSKYFLEKMIPGEYSAEHYQQAAEKRKDETRPAFSITAMGNNFRRFNARVGVVFVLQHRLIRLLQWKNPTHTYAFLAVYAFVCLDPSLLAVLPFVSILLFIMVPTFIARHPAPPSTLPTEPYSAHGAPIAPPIEVKAVGELSREFFRNLRDLQNSMDDFSNAHDAIIRKIGPPTNFSDERLSSGVYLFFLLLSLLLFLTARLFPWRLIFLYHGWLLFALTHPRITPLLTSASSSSFADKERILTTRFLSFTHSEFLLDEAPETRELEIFELQRRENGSEWVPWLFSPHPYDPLSAPRIAHMRPVGTRFFEDVVPPEGWEFREKKWSVDLGSRDWVVERCITGVEVETEGERWVYDIEAEGEYEWRRRRWVREVRRKVVV